MIPDVECVHGCWYARDVFALLAHPETPAVLRTELQAWASTLDINVRTGRPFVVLSDGRYSFDWRYRRDVAGVVDQRGAGVDRQAAVVVLLP